MFQNLQSYNKFDPTQNMHTYYDINFMNNDQQGNPTNSLVYTESRNMPYLKNPSNYYVSIVRFSLMSATPSIPVFIPHVQLGQNDVNKTVYEFTIFRASDSTYHTLHVSYIPSNSNLSVNPPLTVQDLSNEYYFCYSYSLWVEMMNSALATLATSLGIAVPYFQFDITTSLLKLYIPYTWGGVYNLLVNQRLYMLLDSIPATFSTDPTTNKSYYTIYEIKTPVQQYYKPVGGTPPVYWEITQETTSISLLNPVSSIVFTTALLPLNNNLTSPPQIFNTTSTFNSNGNNSNISPIITDFQVNVSNGNTYKNSIEYTPTAEYRLVDIMSDTPISSIEVSVFWKDVYGVLHPYRLAAGASGNLKLLFRNKSFNTVV